MQLSSDVFNKVVQDLANHQEALRIKKLIFCICKKYWENDTTILNSIPLDDLIQELVQGKQNNEQLTFSIYKLVKTLNRPKVYAPVAKVIIDKVSRLYHIEFSYSEEDTQILSKQVETSKINNNSDLVIDQVVANLANHEEGSRIKKLIFAACKNKWENNVAIIDRYGLKKLILELRQINQNKMDLKQSFNQIVESINKKNLYVAICNVILNQIEMLYDTDVEYEEEQESKEQTKIFDTQIIHIDKSQVHSTPSSNQYQPNQNQEFATSIVDVNNPEEIFTELNFTPSPALEQPVKEYDPFEVRLDIMQYTNTLRAKILLFSILFHPWDRSGQDWSTLRSYTLEDLIELLIQSGKTLKEIESRLYGAAKTQTDVDANLQTASVLLQAVQHIL
jgi:hypothetical protein